MPHIDDTVYHIYAKDKCLYHNLEKSNSGKIFFLDFYIYISICHLCRLGRFLFLISGIAARHANAQRRNHCQYGIYCIITYNPLSVNQGGYELLTIIQR